jgi:hypothetical protein
VEETHQAYVSTGYTQGFLTGTTLAVSAYSVRQSDNATTGLFNPDFTSSFSIGFAQHLLNSLALPPMAVLSA